MSTALWKNLTCAMTIFGLLAGCKQITEGHDSSELIQYRADHPEVTRLGQIRFLADPLGSLTLKGLMEGNIMPFKIYGTALLLAESGIKAKLDSNHVAEIFEHYGLMRPTQIQNWNTDLGPAPKLGENLGLIHADIDERILGQRYKVQVANISCGGCHSSPVFDKNGNATKAAWIGGANTSLHLDGLLAQIYQGLKIGLADQQLFMQKIREAYPLMDADEDLTIEKKILPKVAKEIKKMAGRQTVLPFKNGGPGLANGLGQFKKNANLFPDKYAFYPSEANYVQIPDLTYRFFKSSFTVDGINGSIGYPRFQVIDLDKLKDKDRLQDLAKIVTFFPYLAMSALAENLVGVVPQTQAIFNDFMVPYRPQPYPGPVDESLAQKGSVLFSANCAKCHGTYTAGIKDLHLVSYPNRLVPQEIWKTDPVRWQNVTQDVLDFSKTSELNQLSKPAPPSGGYVAPILSSVWSTAPYLHNGSVPTLWHLMNPEIRPRKFQYGGHAIDFNFVGIRAETNAAGDWMYNADYQSWSQSFVYDTSEYGKSNQGHERPFEGLSTDEKRQILEYLKLL